MTVEERSAPAAPTVTRPDNNRPRMLIRRYWVPLLLLVILAGLTASGINGSSAAAIRGTLGSSLSSDSHLLAGAPLDIRADEWAINTPLSIMQVRTGMPRIQPLMGSGADMALSFDVPIADQWAVFHPQHWGFLVMPLDQGFAFHWWFPAVLLIFAMWLLTVTLMPTRNLLGLLLGAAAAFSPFLQWWYLAGSFLPEALALLACALFIRILHAPSRRWLVANSILMTWVLGTFALLLYPPFQIPCALVATAFCVGYLIFAAGSEGWRPMLIRLAVVAGCGGIAGVFVLLFLFDHRVAVQALASSVYPGNRTVDTGGYSISRLFSGFLDRRLTLESAAKSIDVNQSEASSPLFAGLFVLPIYGWLLVSGRRRGLRPNPVILLLIAVLTLFLVHLFVPNMGALARLTLLDRVPGNRLLLGLGMLSNLLLVAVAWQVSKFPTHSKSVVAGAFGVPFAVLTVVALYLNLNHSIFVGSLVVAGLLAVAVGVAVATWATRRPVFGAALLLLVSLVAAGNVNPISIGAPTTDDLPITAALMKVDQADPGGWILQANRAPMGALLEQSIHSYSVVYNYPQLSMWHELDPSGSHSDSYNRYGYADFRFYHGPTLFPEQFLDQFTIYIDACAPFVQKRVKHILTGGPIDTGCVRLRQTKLSGTLLFYIYDVIQPAEDLQLGR